MRAWAALGAVVLGVAACGGGDDGADQAGTTQGSTAPSSPTSAAAPVAASPGYAECVDPQGDGTGGAGADLVKVSLTRQESGVLAVSYQLAGDAVPPSGAASWILAVDPGSAPVLSLGVKVVGSEPPTMYSFDWRTARQDSLTSARSAEGNTVTGEFPLSLDPLLAGSFHWRAVVNAAGADADSCEGTFPQS